MTPHEAERIAAAVNVLRPDWPTRSLMTLLGRPQLASKPRRDVAVALAWIACETNTANPGRVLEAGPWWRAAAVAEPGGASTTLKREDECPSHPGRPANACGGCRADVLAADADGALVTPEAVRVPAGASDPSGWAAKCRDSIKAST